MEDNQETTNTKVEEERIVSSEETEDLVRSKNFISETENEFLDTATMERLAIEQAAANKKKNRKKSIIKYVLNISFVLIVTAVALFLTLKDDFNTIIDTLANSDIRWILFVVGILLMMMIIRGTILFCFARLYTRNYHIYQGIAVDQIGTFYNAVTPGASGGEIMEAYTFKKQGVPISSAVSIMAMYSIIYQFVLIIYGVTSFIVKYDLIISLDNWSFAIGSLTISIPVWLLAIIGFILNVSVILIVLLMAYWHGFHNFIMGPCITFLNKIKIIKKPDDKREQLRVQVENFKIEFRRLLTNIPFTILIAILFFVMLTLKFSIPYFVGLALGNQSEVASFWDSVFLSNFHQMVTGLIPIPGSAGVSELFFHELFLNSTSTVSGFYYALDPVTGKNTSEALCKAALLIWRSITFSIPIIIGGFVSAFYKASASKAIGRDEALPDRETMTQMQAETLGLREAEVTQAEETQSINRQKVIDRLKSMNKKEQTSKNQKKTHKKKVDKQVDDEYRDIDISEDDE